MENKNLSLMLGVAVIAALICIEFTAMVLTMTPLTHTFAISFSQAQWVIGVYFIAFAACVITGGRIGDLFGEKKVLMIGVGLFIIASLVGGVATNFPTIIVARIAQALGAGTAYTNNMSLLLKNFSQHKHGQVLGIYASIIGFSITLGPIIGGLITHYLTWRWVFLMNVPFGIISLGILFYLPDSNGSTVPNSRPRLDLLGAFFSTIAIIALIYTIDNLNLLLQRPEIIIFTIVIMLLASYLFLFFAKRTQNPLVQLQLFSYFLFRYGVSQRLMMGCINSILLFSLGIYLINSLHYSIRTASFLYLPYTLFAGIFSAYAGKLIGKINIYKILRLALLLLLLGFGLMLCSTTFAFPLIILLLALAIAGSGYSILLPGLLTTAMRQIEIEHRGVANGIFYMASLTGCAVGAAIAGLFLHHSGTQMSAAAVTHSMNMIFTFATLIVFIMLCLTFCNRHKLQKSW